MCKKFSPAKKIKYFYREMFYVKFFTVTFFIKKIILKFCIYLPLYKHG